MEVIYQVFTLFLLLVTGYVAKKLRVISNDLNRDLSNLILYIALPALILSSLSNYDFSHDMMIQSFILIFISLGVYAVSIGLAYSLTKIMKLKGPTRDIFQYGVIFSNVGFMGYPVVDAVFGENGIFYAAIYNLPFNILTWTLGIMIMSRTIREKTKGSEQSIGNFGLKDLFNPGIISVFLGFAMFLTSTKLPYPLFKTLDILGNTSTPLSMIFIGSVLADIDVKKIFANYYVFLSAIIRLLVLPLAVFGILGLFDFDKMIIGIPVIITAMPVAVNCPMFAVTYDSDYEQASQLIFISTLLSIGTISLIAILL